MAAQPTQDQTLPQSSPIPSFTHMDPSLSNYWRPVQTDYKFAEIASIMNQEELKKKEAVVDTTQTVVANMSTAEADAEAEAEAEAKQKREDLRGIHNLALMQLDMAIMRLELVMQKRLEASVEAKQEWERNVSQMIEFVERMKP